MKKTSQQKLPPGWNQKKVHELIGYYDNQSDDEGAVEIDSARDASGEAWMSVPTALVSTVARLIDEHLRNGTTKARPTRSQKTSRK